ncbi:MAG: co-chaperone DjlA [Gammaproteobacteria bacterium]|nr:co-chaperone DjlA [Gammaproteobacteria bacterium]
MPFPLPIILAAVIGFLLGGPIGAVVLGTIVWWLRRSAPMRFLRDLKAIQSQFLDSTFAVMGALCKADGRVTEAEIRTAESLFERLRLNPEGRRNAQASFQRGKAADFDLDGELQRFMKRCGRNRALLSMFLQVQLSAVAADGALHPAEHEMLLRVARGLGLPESEVRRLEAMLGAGVKGAPASADALAAAYDVLGLTPEASDSEVKKAYRRQVSQNHPDKLAARGLPESMRALAEERTREIVEAHDRIMAARKAS